MNNELIVLYEDNHIIVVIKPQNVPTQADSSCDPDMLTIVKQYIHDKYNKPGNVFVGLVHRLDRPTGGVMVFAKTSKAASRLCEQIAHSDDFEKHYITVVDGCPRDMHSLLRNYLVKDMEHNIVRIVPAKVENAKLAELEYRVLERNSSNSLVDVKLMTGRSHQIRVQMQGVGCPVYGDAKYGARTGRGSNLALWAYSLRFVHPVTQNIMVFRAFPPIEDSPWKFFNVAKHVDLAKPQ